MSACQWLEAVRWTNDSPLRPVASRSVSSCDILRATLSAGESWASYVVALCIVCWSVVYPPTWSFISDLRYGCWAYRKMRLGGGDLMGIAWRVACLVWRARRRLARRDLGICLLHRVWLARVRWVGLPRLYCDLRCLCAKEQNTNSDTDSRVGLGESGRPYRYRSGSIMCPIIRRRQTSLVYCDSYEAVHRTMNSTTC